jgi:hypothetical protein
MNDGKTVLPYQIKLQHDSAVLLHVLGHVGKTKSLHMVMVEGGMANCRYCTFAWNDLYLKLRSKFSIVVVLLTTCRA